MMRFADIRIFFLVFYFGFISEGRSQGDTTVAQPVRKFHASGYVKFLQQSSCTSTINDLVTNNLLHNRLNFRYEPNKHISARIEMRNRLYYGELVKATPEFASLLKSPNDLFDLSKTWINERTLVLHSTIDRASVNFKYGKWDVTLGRQRINWGINTVWTPNDIFNSFNYFDFDYEERPGSDAVRVQYLISGFSALELAVRPGKNEHDQTGALLYRFNKWNYDFQFFSGLCNEDLVAGAGWAGNIRDVGFKGETTYFHSRNDFNDTIGIVDVSATVDYVFKNGMYGEASFLFNSNGEDHLPALYNFLSTTLSVKNLMPFKYSTFLQLSKAFTPIFSGNASFIFSPADYTLITLPSLNYSLADNWELSLVGQSFFAQRNGKYHALANIVFLRIKMGF